MLTHCCIWYRKFYLLPLVVPPIFNPTCDFLFLRQGGYLPIMWIAKSQQINLTERDGVKLKFFALPFLLAFSQQKRSTKSQLNKGCPLSSQLPLAYFLCYFDGEIKRKRLVSVNTASVGKKGEKWLQGTNLITGIQTGEKAATNSCFQQ